MKSKLVKILGLTAALVCGNAFAATDGDIWEILPCDRNGVEVARPVSSAAETIPAGSNIYFKVRLVARNGASKWHLQSQTVYEEGNPLRIGLSISGKIVYADYIGEMEVGDHFTDVIFKYLVKAGDFALPIRLMTENGPADDQAVEGLSYAFDPLTSWRWKVVNDNGDTCNWWFFTGDPTERSEPNPADSQDISLKEAGFYLKTIDFDSNWAEAGSVWRRVKQGSESIKGGSTPTLVAVPDVVETATLYVWSTNEDAVVVKSGWNSQKQAQVAAKQVTMRVGGSNSSPINKTFWVASVDVVGGSAKFEIHGVAEGGLSHIVLSANDHFNYWVSTGARIIDYIDVPVECVEPPAPSIVAVPEDFSIIANSDYTHKATKLNLAFENYTPDHDVTVKVTPVFQHPDAKTASAKWEDYLRFYNKPDNPVISSSTGCTFVIPAGRSVPDDDIYIFALRGDSWVDGSSEDAHIQFVISTEDTAVKAEVAGWDVPSSEMSIQASAPIVEVDPAMTTNAVAGVEKKFSLLVTDGTYADKMSLVGYEVYVVTNSTESPAFVKLDGMFKPDAYSGKLIKVGTDDELPGIIYGSDVIAQSPVNTRVRVKSPISGRITDIDIVMNVEEPLGYFVKVIDDEGREIPKTAYKEGEEFGSGAIKIYFANGHKHYGSDIYAFLVPSTPDARKAIQCSFLAQNGGQGIAISGNGGGGEENPAIGSFVMIDGRNSSNSAFTYNVELRTAPIYEEGTKVDKYGSKGSIVLNSLNIAPSVDSVDLGAYNTEDDNWKYLMVPMNVEQLLTAYVNEPGIADLLATGDESFQCQWRFVNGSISAFADNADAQGIVYGNPEDNPAKITFTAAGTWKCTLKVMDKDQKSAGTSWSKITSYTFEVNVVDKPSIHVTASYGRGNEEDADRLRLSENESLDAAVGDLNANIHIGLDYNNCNFPMTVHVTVVPPSSNPADNPGTLSLLESSSVVKTADNEYDVTFAAGVKDIWIAVKTLDGTPLSRTDGFSFEPKVTTHKIVPGSGNQYADDYYIAAAGNRAIKIDNVAPVIEFLNPLPSTNSIPAAIGQVDEAITWDFSDVTYDFDKGITVVFKGGGGYEATFFSKAEATAAGAIGFRPTFSSSGRQMVQMSIKDIDNGTATYDGQPMIWYYEVEISKNMVLTPHGPTSGKGTNLSKKYRNASGIGEGRVWTSGDSGVSGFEHTINCQREKTWNVYGYGYKVGDVDGEGTDRLFHYPDGRTGYYQDRSTGINTSGKSGVGGPWYTYNPDDNRDSFLYTWIQIVRGDGSSTLTDTLLNGTVLPEYSEVYDAGTIVGLPAEQDEDGNYDDTLVEAVFAKELYPADNMGDINADGIPDIHYAMYWFNQVSAAAAGGDNAGTTSIDDLKNLSTDNSDKDKNGSEVGDYLPGMLDAIETHLASRASEMKDFKAVWEIRGFGPGLNDATASMLPNNDGSFTANPCAVIGVKPDRRYTNPITDPSSTLTYVEYLAWVEFAAAHVPALDPSVSSNWDKWSPERPTNPVVADTDGDGFDDGFEYYFWYRAHVGYLDAQGNHRYLTGRRYDERNPGEGRLIDSDEIARKMDPIVASDETAITADSDNDGLPDLLEFELGTNPFDFDTDGDGLPDGWEVMIAGTDPLVVESLKDGKSDTERNNDGDAMAITSAELEKSVMPVPTFIQQLTTVALLDANGDTDGVQWYATKGDVAVKALEGDDLNVTTFKLAGDPDRLYATTADLTGKVVDGRLAVTLKRYDISGNPCTFVVVDNTFTSVVAEDETASSAAYVAGYPVYLSAGTLVTDVAGSAVPCARFKVAEAVDPALANACWIYGKGTADNLKGDVAKSAAEYGCLAIARQQAIPADAFVVAMPAKTRDVAYLHYLVYQEFGFDPRTAWKAKSPLANRWSMTDGGGQAFEGVFVVQQGGYCTYPTRTRDFAAYDEFLVHSFFVNNGCDMSGVTYVVDDKAPLWARIWGAFTTNPQGPGDAVITDTATSADTTAEGSEGSANVSYFGANSENGADTDGDGVPDGWELYVMAGPKKNGAYVFAPPYVGFTTSFGGEAPKSFWSPFVASAQDSDTGNQIYLGGQANSDTLNQYEEFEGTDTMAYYADYSTTIVHKGEWKWFNKFFPTDPWNVDTDQDGVKDNEEKGAFAYGTPADDGKLWSIPGGGLNPCSTDTDLDGLPDGWERQYEKSVAERHIYDGEKAFRAKDADGNEIGNPLEGLDNCMDGTVPDAYNLVNGDSTPGASGSTSWTVVTFDGRRWSGHVDRDYDHDGLENWQEYLVGTMRCWRYDDPFSPWTAFDESVYFDEHGNFDPVRSADILGIEGEDDDKKAAAFWYETLVNSAGKFYNPHFITGMSSTAQYFTRVKNPWDTAYLDATLSNGKADGAYYYLKDVVGGKKIADTWSKVLPLPEGSRKYPNKYISCSPIDEDTDCDGMDDYYELFHGMNPLLGASGVTTDTGDACDIVYDAWYNTSALAAFGSGETENYWQRNPWKTPRGENGMDFEVFPYLNGLENADPDGDDIRNNKEFLSSRMKDIGSHTDPTPLWMTDSSYSNSLVRLHYRMPMRINPIMLSGDGFTYEDVTYKFADFDGFGPVGLFGTGGFMPFNLDSFWSFANVKEANWMFSFEENEGYDTDHDALGDREERDGLYRSAMDPLDADSPIRRQAMYFPGANAALQTMPEVREEYPVATRPWPTDPSFQNFTVECWAKAEDPARDQTIIERAIWVDPSNVGDQEYLRRNFQLALRGGKWMAKYDSGTLTNDEVKAFSTGLAEAKWTHLAATFDGNAFRFYVNGICQNGDLCGVKVLPENGVSAYAFVKGTGDYARDVKYECKAILVGASFKGSSEGGKPEALDVTSALGWNYYRDFFKGYVDEIRIWDGARTSKEIGDDMRKRYTAADAKANRSDFYDQWAAGQDRYALATTVRVVPELRYHFHFDSVPGAADADSVMKVPTGFQTAGGKPVVSRPVGYAIDWFAKIADANAYGTVYGPDFDWIQWIPNTVAHLPRFDGTTLDSFFWSADYSGAVSDANTFVNTAEPVSRWTQMAYNGVTRPTSYKTTSMRHHLVYALSNATSAVSLYLFTGRHLNQMGDDLLPLGGAFVKYAEELWDGDEQGPSTQWEHTGIDLNGNNLPDWYEEFIRQTYGIEGEVSPDTDVFAYGRTMKVRELYLIDLARGIVRTADGASGEFNPQRIQSADLDKDGLPDWWEEAYRIHTAETDLSVGHADDDPDNDGLSNYQEYLASAIYGFYQGLNPWSSHSGLAGQTVTDYFLPITNEFPWTFYGRTYEEPQNFMHDEYLGAILTDHDFMEDWWENKYAKNYTSAKIYDPWDDTDGDGWSNFAECRAFMWGGAFASDIIDRWLDGTATDESNRVLDYPRPAIGVKITYANDQINDIDGKGLIVRTRTTGKRVDATFVIHGTDAETVEAQDHMIGSFYEGVTIHGFLNPGWLLPNDVKLYMAQLSAADIYTWRTYWSEEDYKERTDHYWEYSGTYAEYRSAKRLYHWVRLISPVIQWGDPIAMVHSDKDAHFGELIYTGEGGSATKIGTVDFYTGEYTLDLVKLRNIVPNTENSIFKFAYSYKIGKNWPQTLWLSDTFDANNADDETTGNLVNGSGRVKEGLNTIEAFIDYNNNGRWDSGEPYGMVKDVPVGWHKVPEITLELTDESLIVPRTLIPAASTSTGDDQFGAGQQDAAADKDGDDGATTATKVRIVRDSINGIASSAVVVSGLEFVMDDRAYLTEADVMSATSPDLDWDALVADADKLGIVNIASATYRIESYGDSADDSTVAQIGQPFTRKFSNARPVVAPVAPIANAPVYTDAPTFQFTADKDTTAFAIQVADDDGMIIYDSGVQMLGGRASVTVGNYAYKFTAPIYANTSIITNGAPVLVDGKSYKWRVVSFNAKYNTAKPSDYCEWTPFQMDVGNINRYPVQPTGYGKVGAIVRYFGLAKTNDLTNLIVVEAFENADFTGQALAQIRVANLADISDATARINTFDCTNAILAGLDVGTVYLRAYVDLNNNGRCDRYEPWGYANMVGEYGTDYSYPPIYNPKGIEVGASAVNLEKPNFATIFIEDTDLNKNEIPDCLENWPDTIASDWWTWAGITEDHLEYAAAGDVMAYAEVDRVMVIFSDGTSALVAKGAKRPTVGDTAVSCNNGNYDSWYRYGDQIGLGLPVTVSDTTLRITAVDDVKVALVHAQVYDEFGYDMNTANAEAFDAGIAVNTKPFTAADKKRLICYLEAIGFIDPSDLPANTDKMFEDYLDELARTDAVSASRLWQKYSLKVGDPDNNRDGIADGWNLYVMFNGKEVAACTPWTSAAAARTMTTIGPSGEGLTWVQEFDGGHYPTDPWNIDTPASGEKKGDGVIDYYAYQYHLKGEDSWKDFDGDGLSNYAEYLASEVFRFAKCDPDQYATSDGVCDYFRKVGDLYLGEILMDHDQVDDAWEHEHAKGANMSVYDPFRDDDGDGWSNYAESKVGTDPSIETTVGIDEYTIAEYPVPVVKAEVVYNGKSVILDQVVFKAWNDAVDPDMTSVPDAIWTFGTAAEDTDKNGKGGSTTGSTSSESGSTLVSYEKYLGKKPSGVRSYTLYGGSISEGSIKIAFKDTSYATCVLDSHGNPTDIFAGEPENAKWYYNIIDNAGKLVMTGSVLEDVKTEVGSIDYKTGVITIDFDNPELCGKRIGDPGNATGSTNSVANTSGGHGYDLIDFDNSYLQLSWKAKRVGLTAAGTYYLADADKVSAAAKSHGHLREGKNTFICYVSEDGTYKPGQPFGIVRGVDVGWQGAKFTVELTETSAITPRVDIWNSEESDRSVTFSEYAAMPLTDRTATPEQLAALSNAVQAASAEADTSKARLRVVRFGVNGMYAYRVGVGFNVSNVIDRVFDKDGRSYLCEADFLRDGEFDIEWNTLNNQVIKDRDVQLAVSDVTNMTYFAVLEGGSGFETWIRGAGDSNTVIRALGTTIERRFEKTQHKPVVENVDAVCYGARPTFRWSLPNEEPFAKKYGTSYTAFKLQVWSTDNKKIYDSGVRRAPVQDKDGIFSWTADLSAGDLTLEGKVFTTPGNYKWCVAMYNAKFQPVSDTADMFSTMGSFSIAANTQQEMNDHQYSSIDVAVKYAGPANVIAQYADLATLKGKVRVQAFATADFAGEPLSETVVTTNVTDFASTVANARLIGLDATGTYYIRAYIDSDGDHKRSEWESWGAAKTPVVLSTALNTAPLVGVWIEDTDVDQDWMPDAWEYAKFGTIAQYSANVGPSGRTIFTTDMEESAKTLLTALSTGLEGASLTIFENGSWAKTLLGWGGDGSITFGDIRAAVQGELDVKSGTFKITSLTLGPDGKVTLAVDAEVAPTIAGTLLSTVYDITPGAKKTVKLLVYRKTSLAMVGWGDPIKDVTVSLGAGEQEIRDVGVDVTAEDLKSGFYKIDVVE